MHPVIRSVLCARILRGALCAFALLPVAPDAPLYADEVVQADPILRTRKATIIERPCSVVWPYLSNFSGIGTWYKAFRLVRHHSGPVGQVGEVREIVRASNGQLVREKLIYLDAESMELGYTHVLNPPVRDNVALVSLTPVAQGQCEVVWSNTYRLKPGQQASEAAAFFNKAYPNVLSTLKAYVEAQGPTSGASR